MVGSRTVGAINRVEAVGRETHLAWLKERVIIVLFYLHKMVPASVKTCSRAHNSAWVGG